MKYLVTHMASTVQITLDTAVNHFSIITAIH